MRKSFNTYLIIWILALVLFNLIIFIIPSTIDGETIINISRVAGLLKIGNYDSASIPSFGTYLIDNELVLNKYAGAFWPSYVCIMFAFIGQLLCSIYVFKESDNQKFFYNVPLIRISYLGLILTLVFGTIGMFYPEFPIWLSITICIIMFVITLISLLRAKFVSDVISNKDDEIEKSSTFIKEMTAKAKALWDADKQNEEFRKLYEAFRYSKKLSNIKTVEIEKEINDNFDDVEKVIRLLKERDRLC